MTYIRSMQKADFVAVLNLNAAEVQQTSPMDAERLQQLVDFACYAKVAVADGEVAGFLLALSDGADYENDNYGWFATRFSRFVYVDRIVVAASFSGRGIGGMLYRDLFEYARSIDADTVACEYNIVPPNPVSQAFHDRFGFKEQGTQWTADGAKQVSLQVAALSAIASQ